MNDTPQAPAGKQPGVVVRYNHFDPLWRRCWDRNFYDAGRRFVSYRAIEESWINDAIATCADGESCFMLEASWVLRHYLERHPEHMDTMRRLTHEGRFELLGSGENIVDGNLIHGELLARNLILGTLWAQDTLGLRPTTGWHSDGFGSSAQMPQIFRQCGCEWMAAISYNVPDAPYWRGLDGSTLFDSKDHLPHRWATTGPAVYQKLPPCPACQGEGCTACGQRGFVVGERAEFSTPPTAPIPGKVGVLLLWGEEIHPGLHVAEDIARFNAISTDFTVRQGIYRDLRAYIAEELARVDNPPADEISSKVENNPGQSGCYVSRIRIKQEHRRAEHALLAAECWDSWLAQGAQAARLREAWRKMTLSAFHDSITSSHCDEAYQELLDLLDEVQHTAREISTAACGSVLTAAPRTATLFNHLDFPATAPVTVQVPEQWAGATVSVGDQALPVYAVTTTEDATAITFLARDIPALAAQTVTLAEAPACPPTAITATTVSCGDFTVHAGEHGIESIDAAGLGQVMDAQKFLFAEPILESDLGDPWATRSLERTRERLSPYTTLTGITQQQESLVLTYAGAHPTNANPHRCADPLVTLLNWEQRFILREGLPWIEVATTVDWYTQSRRLRLAFPTTTDMNRGVYDIPYGVLERDRYEGTTTYGGNAGGDWPAIHWAGIQTPAYTYAVFNQGTPSYRVEDGTVLVSVLRSPIIPYGLFEPASYVAYNFWGMMDHGRHTFRHALYLGSGDWRENTTGRQAELFNAGLMAMPGMLASPLPGWQLQADHTHLATIKAAEDGQGMILRFVEHAGGSETIRLRLPQGCTAAYCCNLLEDNLAELPMTAGTISLDVAPWKIVTVRLAMESAG